MSREDIQTRVIDTLVELFELPREALTPDARFVEDLDLDSIDAVDLAVKLREQTGKSLDEEQLRRLRTVSDIVELLVELMPSEAEVVGNARRGRHRRS